MHEEIDITTNKSGKASQTNTSSFVLNEFQIHDDIITNKFGKVSEGEVTHAFVLGKKVNESIIEYCNAITQQIEKQELFSNIPTANDDIESELLLSLTKPEEFQELLESTFNHAALHPFNPITVLLHEELRKKLKYHINSPFAFINTRMWITRPNSNHVGPNSMHKDGFEPGHLKVMIYPYGLNGKNGGFRTAHSNVLNAPKGSCICFKNSDVSHMGIPGTKANRVSIEVTIQRSLIDLPQLNNSHVSGRHLRSPWEIYKIANRYREHCCESQQRPLYINIGSGNRQWGENWLCLDEISCPEVTCLRLNKYCIFPSNNSSIKLIYSSHHFEHQPDDTVDQLFLESYRCLEPGGIFLLKIPDYDFFLNAYRDKDIDALKNKGFEKIIWSWKSKGVLPTYLNFISMMFCGYWNNHYGDHFSREINRTIHAYHGPAVLEEQELVEVLDTNDPHYIASYLKGIALKDPDFKQFNHQNAWSSAQITELASKHGLHHIDGLTKDNIIKKYKKIVPDIENMSEWSMMHVFIKK